MRTKITILLMLVASLFAAAGSFVLLWPVFKPAPRHFLRVVKQGPTEQTGQKTIILRSDEYGTDYTGLESACDVNDPLTGVTNGPRNCPVPLPPTSLEVGKDENYFGEYSSVTYIEVQGRRTVIVKFHIYPELP